MVFLVCVYHSVFSTDTRVAHHPIVSVNAGQQLATPATAATAATAATLATPATPAIPVTPATPATPGRTG